MEQFKHVKVSSKKIDGLSLAKGKALFTDDFTAENTLHLAVLRSPHPFAKITDLDDSEARIMPGVVEVFSHKNVKPVFYTTAGQGYPEPSPYDTTLFGDVVRFVGDEVAVAAAEDVETARAACKSIRVTYEPLTPILDYHESLKEGAPVIHPEKEARMMIPAAYHPEKNLAAEIEVEIGNIQKAFDSADEIIENTFQTPITSHCAIEPHATFTYLDEMERLVIISTTQVPFHVRRIVSKILDIPLSKIRVIKPRLGGGFGGKQEIITEPFAALVTWKTGRPAKLVYSRREVFTGTRTRHAQTISIKAGFTEGGGIITGLKMDALENTGAYGTHALTVLSNTAMKVLPLFNKIENIAFSGKAVYSNLPIAGAYRGYGASQGYFAYCQTIDMICIKAGIDPVDYYAEHTIKTGEGSPIFEAIGEGREGISMTLDSVALSECLEAASEAFRWKEKRNLYTPDFNKGKRKKRGVGMACVMQGSAIPYIDMASAYMKLNDDGSCNLNIGATDIGTGSDTVLAQIAAETLDIPLEKIIVISSDTDTTPFDTGAYASSTTYLSGGAVKKCAEKLLEQIKTTGAELLETDSPNVMHSGGNVCLKNDPGKCVSYGDICTYSLYDKNQYQIQAHASHVVTKSPPPFSAHFAEIEVDTETGVISVLKYVTATDCGTPINPVLAEGQIEGALVNGLTYALTEEYLFSQNGVLRNGNFSKYKIYSAADIPEIRTILIGDSYEKTGPYGAKSIAEVAINGPMPVIANAFFHAAGKRLFKAPFTPEYVYSVLKE